jgi:hypothetical protein
MSAQNIVDSLKRKTAQEESETSVGIALYLAAAFGGLLVGFGDLIRSGSDSGNVTVLRISGVLREQFSPVLGAAWAALLLLAVLSMVICWIYRPSSKRESFALGLSVFAVLTASTPYQLPREQFSMATTSLTALFISPAYAQSELRDDEPAEYYFQFEPHDARLRGKTVALSIYDKSEQTLLKTVTVKAKDVGRIELPKGDYVAYIECQGCLRVRAGIKVDKPTEASKVVLAESSVPLSLQRLYRPEVATIQELPEAQAYDVAEQYETGR